VNTNTADYKPPFPWFGGKSRAAQLVWERFGDVPNYVEPFFGSGAVLFKRPHPPKLETVNDLDGFISNFWRAVQADSEAVAHHADWPVNECDLHARHIYLLNSRDELTDRLMGDPDYYDAKLAGWWVWGISTWIGSGWCSGDGPWQSEDGKIVNMKGGVGVSRQIPHLGNAGQGVHGLGVSRKRPHLGDAGRGVNRPGGVSLGDYLAALQSRLRGVRVVCGDWSRVMGPTVTFKHGITGVLLDPPYDCNRDTLYAKDSFSTSHDARAWAIKNGDNSLLRIALCGYDGEHDMPPGWTKVAWTGPKGYQGKGNTKRFNERIWFSPHCLKGEQGGLWATNP